MHLQRVVLVCQQQVVTAPSPVVSVDLDNQRQMDLHHHNLVDLVQDLVYPQQVVLVRLQQVALVHQQHQVDLEHQQHKVALVPRNRALLESSQLSVVLVLQQQVALVRLLQVVLVHLQQVALVRLRQQVALVPPQQVVLVRLQLVALVRPLSVVLVALVRQEQQQVVLEHHEHQVPLVLHPVVLVHLLRVVMDSSSKQ